MNLELTQKFASTAAQLAGAVDEIAERAVEQIRAQAPEYAVETPELAEALAEGSRPSILAELVAMQRDPTPPDEFPEVDAEGARLAARYGVPIGTVAWVYQVGHQVQWDAWFRAVERDEHDPDARRQLLEAGSRYLFDYANRISTFVTAEYVRERDLLLQSHEQRRVNLVRELLAGAEVDSGALDYEINGRWHLGLIASGDHAPDTVRELGRGLDRQPLLVEVLEGSWWAWLGGGVEIAEAGLAVVARLQPAPGTRITIGTDAHGREGFRRTHAEAESAYWVTLNRDLAVTRFEDTALEVLAGGDHDAALEFVARELRGLDGDDRRSAKLRETLRAYFASGHNAAATAARLGVHEQTVSNRLHTVEQRIGHAVAARRAELETALRLRDYLAGRGTPAG